MGIAYEDAVKAKKKLRIKLLSDPNVVSVGVVVETNEFGEPTGDYSIQVGVISINAYSRAQKHGQSAIPVEFFLNSEDGSGEEKHIHIHVVREGKIEALTNFSTFKKFKKDDIPSAIDDLPESTKSTVSYTLRRRPSPCGQSIGHPDTTAGTQGLLLEYAEGGNSGKAYILSNNHVIAANNLASIGDNIIQPGSGDLGTADRDTIALLHRWVPLRRSKFNYVDAAIAEVKGGTEWPHYVSPYINHIGFPGSLVDADIGMSVEKVGRTTGRTQGEIVSSDIDINIDYPMGRLMFVDQIRTTNMSKPGDSGSCLVEVGTKKPVGLLFAGSDIATYYNPMSTVLSLLSRKFTNKYPSGKTHTFSADYPLRILQTRSYATSIVPNFAVPRNYIKMGVAKTRYGTAIAVASIGQKKLSASFHSLNRPMVKADGFLYRTSSSSSFFRSSSSIAKPQTAYCRNQLIGSIIKLCSRR